MSNLYTLSLPVRTMAEGDNEVTRTNEELRLALDAANKRNSDLLINQQMGETVLTEVASLKHMFQAHQPGLSDEAKKARIAPGKPCSCVLNRVNTRITI